MYDKASRYQSASFCETFTSKGHKTKDTQQITGTFKHVWQFIRQEMTHLKHTSVHTLK
jgi:hypothetical protein